MFEEMHKIEGIEYAMQQITAMIEEGASFEAAATSMRAELQNRKAMLSMRVKNLGDVLDRQVAFTQ